MAASPARIVARFGYAARGGVYLLIGGLALRAGLGGGERRGADLEATLVALRDDPLGLLVVLAIAIGLLAYALWKAVQGVLDADGNGAGGKGLVVRGGMVTSAVTHASLGFFALALPFTLDAGPRGGTSLERVAGWLLAQPSGRHALAILALVVIGAGLSQCWKGWSGGYRKHLAIQPALMDRLAPICAFGLVARGLVLVIIGGLLLLAAPVAGPNATGGTARAMDWLGSQSGGGYLFTVIAAGLFAFGLYGMIQAAGRRVDLAEPACDSQRQQENRGGPGEIISPGFLNAGRQCLPAPLHSFGVVQVGMMITMAKCFDDLHACKSSKHALALLRRRSWPAPPSRS